MATPAISGAAALIQQYIRDRYGKNPSGFLMKSLLMAFADPLEPAGDHDAASWPIVAPNLETGFGQLNLANLPDGDAFKLLILDTVTISDEKHLVSTVTVTGSRSRDLRVTISFFDVLDSLELAKGLMLELHLIVISPSGKLFRGNQFPSDDDEHFCTTSRVLILKDELEVGAYKIHVIARLGSDVSQIDSIEFGAAVVGGIVEGALSFTETTECAGSCGSGGTYVAGICQCPTGLAVGENCQKAIVAVPPGTKLTLAIPAVGNAYIAFHRGSPPGDVSVLVRSESAKFSLVHVLVSDGNPLAMPRDYSRILWEEDNWTESFPAASIDFPSSVIGVLLRSHSPINTTFTVQSQCNGQCQSWRVTLGEAPTAIPSTETAVVLSGSGTIQPASGNKMELRELGLRLNAVVKASGLIVKSVLTLSGNSLLSAADGDKIVLHDNLIINLTFGGGLPRVDLGLIGENYPVVPAAVNVHITANDVDVNTFAADVIVGRTLTNCAEWARLTIFDDPGSFEAVCSEGAAGGRSVRASGGGLSVRGKPRPHDGLPDWAIALIIVGAVIVIAAVVVLICFLCRRGSSSAPDFVRA
jgi:hypothetical protein